VKETTRRPHEQHADLKTLRKLQVKNTVQGADKLVEFLAAVVPDLVPLGDKATQTRHDFIKDVQDGIRISTMSNRLTWALVPFRSMNIGEQSTYKS
jgi:hypothetical protein